MSLYHEILEKFPLSDHGVHLKILQTPGPPVIMPLYHEILKKRSFVHVWIGGTKCFWIDFRILRRGEGLE